VVIVSSMNPGVHYLACGTYWHDKIVSKPIWPQGTTG
jgi:hypothetical protein